mmetsp:Transcript_2805/g.7861  ORF Transcript_2805/g.7861 Transcript_2805/m.7861 type:complete len:313 (+) Transcript_2805:123-1061(+)|eukprot:CAMPEP_0168740842 /NCGR_PEP_ID=MMETSP0724-20121128/12195_1 /TAXON_ID=265536 /ORGANISM="Amphiprora sp., Strain CCMP467" /LENGTH=312 /DNA_ID=CAMNT_0008788305 /DNA_START=107 /DNA_END=1045 /DNA_ORIENTATION=+
MASADAAVGMMDGAYFVGRKELLEFFNTLLDLHLTKIEQTASGAIACQITEMIFPGSIPVARINWEARSDYEFVQNYKLLQAAFSKHHVQRHVDVDKLIRAKYQDNLEFCQWLKAFFDQAYAGTADELDEYNAAAVRAKGKGGRKFNQLQHSGKGKNGTTASARASRPLRERTTTPGNQNQLSLGAPPVASSGKQQQQADTAELTERVAELERTLEEVERERDAIVVDVEKERDFYFGKLRGIEVLLQVHQDAAAAGEDVMAQDVQDKIFQILYATAEDNLTVTDQGQVVVADAAEGEGDEEQLNELLVDSV